MWQIRVKSIQFDEGSKQQSFSTKLQNQSITSIVSILLTVIMPDDMMLSFHFKLVHCIQSIALDIQNKDLNIYASE